jgi:hypothetical protein
MMKIRHRRTEGQKKHATQTIVSAAVENFVRALPEVTKVAPPKVKTKWSSGGTLNLQFRKAENQIGSIIMVVSHGYVKLRYVIYTNNPAAIMAATKNFFAEKFIGKKDRNHWLQANQQRDLKKLAQSLSAQGALMPEDIMRVQQN